MNRPSSENREPSVQPSTRNNQTSSSQPPSRRRHESRAAQLNRSRNVIMISRYLSLHSTILCFSLFLYAIFQLMLTLELMESTAILMLPITFAVVSHHLVSITAKPSSLKYQQLPPKYISIAVKVTDLIAVILGIAAHFGDFQGAKVGLVTVLVASSGLLIISGFNELCHHFEKPIRTTKMNSLMHFLICTYKLLTHIQLLILASAMNRSDFPASQLHFTEPHSYLLSIPFYAYAILFVFCSSQMAFRLNKEKQMVHRAARYFNLFTACAIICGIGAIYLFSFSDLSSDPYFKREKTFVLVSVLVSSLIFSLSLATTLTITIIAKKHRLSVSSPDASVIPVDQRASNRRRNQGTHQMANLQQASRVELNQGNFRSNDASIVQENRMPQVRGDMSQQPHEHVFGRGNSSDQSEVAISGNTFSQLAQVVRDTMEKRKIEEEEEEDSDGGESVNFVSQQSSDRFIKITQNDLKYLIHFKPKRHVEGNLMQNVLTSPNKKSQVIRVASLGEKEIREKRENTKQLIKDQKTKLSLPALESIGEDFDVDVITPKRVIENKGCLPQETELDDIKKLEITLRMFELLEKKNQPNSDQRICKLCCQNIADVVFQPCGHGGVCLTCFLVMIEHGTIQCFYCRRNIDKVYKLDVDKTYKDIFRISEVYKIEKR